MRLLRGDLKPDDGEMILAAGVKVALLEQDVPQDLSGRVLEIVPQRASPGDPAAAESAQNMSRRPGNRSIVLDQLLARMGLDADGRFEALSSGMKRRVLLARALVAAPDVLLLDEPTNHLDWTRSVAGRIFARLATTLIFVTHDRMFLRKLATRILEIDRGRLFDWSCDYDTFLERKARCPGRRRKAERPLFDKRLAEEEVWIRQGHQGPPDAKRRARARARADARAAERTAPGPTAKCS